MTWGRPRGAWLAHEQASCELSPRSSAQYASEVQRDTGGGGGGESALAPAPRRLQRCHIDAGLLGRAGRGHRGRAETQGRPFWTEERLTGAKNSTSAGPRFSVALRELLPSRLTTAEEAS